MISNATVNGNNVPQIYRPRTKISYFDRSQTTGNLGELIPFYINELVLPGETYRIDLSSFCRLTVSKYPTMDNLYLDIYMFFQRKNNLVAGLPQFNGENLTGEFEQKMEYEMPKLVITGIHSSARSLFNRLYNIPFTTQNITADDQNGLIVSSLPYLMYWQVFNDWFRDQNYIPPVIIKKQGVASLSEYNFNMDTLNNNTVCNLTQVVDDPYSTELQKFTLAKACRFHDYQSTIIPEPQKGDPSRIPITGEVEADVYGTGKALMFTGDGTNFAVTSNGQVQKSPTLKISKVDQGNVALGTNVGNGTTMGTLYGAVGVPTAEQLSNGDSGLMTTINLANAVIGTMNDMRTLVAEQHYLERNAIFGTREKEILRARYGVVSSAVTLHIPEYLGGKRIPLNMDSVLQTSSSTDESPLGDPAGYSTTSDSHHVFTKSFDYWGVIMGIAVIRQNHTYAQAIPIQHMKFKPLDFWTPEFNNIGCQPILNKEVAYMPNQNEYNNGVWGYKMPWQEYREGNKRVSGMLSPTYKQPLDEWNYADYYASAPVASQEWLLETPQYLDRTLTVTSKVTDQFIFDFSIKTTKITPVTQFSLPGLDKF